MFLPPLHLSHARPSCYTAWVLCSKSAPVRAFLSSPVGCVFDLLAVASSFHPALSARFLLGFFVSCTSTSLIMQLFFYQAQPPKLPHELPLQ